MNRSRCPQCCSAFTKSKSNQIYCSVECRQKSYYQTTVSNKTIGKITHRIRVELDYIIKLILSPNSNGYSFDKIVNMMKSYGFKNDSSLANYLKKNGFTIENGIIKKYK